MNDVVLELDPRVGDVVQYTTAALAVQAAIITRINADGTVELCAFQSIGRKLEWHSDVEHEPDADSGTDAACCKWTWLD